MIFWSILNSFYIYLFRIPKVPPCHSSMLLFPSRLLCWNWIKSAMFNSTRILTIVWIVFSKNGLYGLTNSKMLQKERCFDIASWQNMKITENTEIRENILLIVHFLRQILIRDKIAFGLKIFVWVQTFRRVPPVLTCNFGHPGKQCMKCKNITSQFFSPIHKICPNIFNFQAISCHLV